MAYAKQTWVNAPSTLTKLNATRLNYMEAGLEAAAAVADNAYAKAFSYTDEFLQDFLDANLKVGTGLTKSYDDVGNSGITFAATGTTIDESSVRSIVVAMLLAGSNITKTTGGTGATQTVTLASTGGGGGGSYTDANARDALLIATALIAGTGMTITFAGTGATRTATINGLQVGTGGTQAKAGNWVPTAADLPAGSLGVVFLTASNPASTATRPAFPNVLWLGGSVEPVNKQGGTDAWIGGDTTITIAYATVVFNGDIEGVTADLQDLTTSNTAFTIINKGGGTNTAKGISTTATPATGTDSARLVQASGGSTNTLDAQGSTAYSDWSGELWFRFPVARPAATTAIWREYNGTVGTGLDQVFTVQLTNAGALLFSTFNVSISAAYALGTATGVTIATNTWYRLRCEGVVADNKIYAILDTGGSAAAIWQDTLVGEATGGTVRAAKDHRVGLGNPGANTTMDLEYRFGYGPGFIAPSFTS